MNPAVLSALVATALGALSIPSSAFAQNGESPTLRAGVLPEIMAIDGVLSEPAWGSADAIDAFTQTDPSQGAPPTGRTVVRVLTGPKALVIGIVCDDPDPGGIVSFSVRRDAALGLEDHVRVVLGPFLDGRSGYVFAVNPGGARYDGLINPGGESDNAEWDGIWEAATARSPAGWSVEIRIPVQTLSFKPDSATGTSTSRPHPADTGNRSVGVPRAAVPGDTNQPRRATHRAARFQSGPRPQRAARGDDRWRRAGPGGVRGQRVSTEPGCHRAARIEHARVGDAEHGLRD